MAAHWAHLRPDRRPEDDQERHRLSVLVDSEVFLDQILALSSVLLRPVLAANELHQ